MPPRKRTNALSAKRQAEHKKKRDAAQTERAPTAELDDLKKLDLVFNTRATAYDSDNDAFLAVAALCAYQPEWAEALFPDASPKFGAIETFVENDWDTEGFTMSNASNFIVAFTGTESLEDWFTNLTFDLRLFSETRVHLGFYEALDEVWAANSPTALVTKIKTAHAKGKHIWFTGHSLGGALALMAGARAVVARLPVRGIYTFGQPLVGDRSFANRFGPSLAHITYRIVNEKDPVPLIPPIGRKLLPEDQWRTYYRRKGKRREKVIDKHKGYATYKDFGRYLLLKPPGPKLHHDESLKHLGCSLAKAVGEVLKLLRNKGILVANHDMMKYVKGLDKNRETILPEIESPNA